MVEAELINAINELFSHRRIKSSDYSPKARQYLIAAMGTAIEHLEEVDAAAAAAAEDARPGITRFSLAVQHLSAQLVEHHEKLTDVELREVMGAAHWLYALLRGDMILRRNSHLLPENSQVPESSSTA
jgi:hypothetical protein